MRIFLIIGVICVCFAYAVLGSIFSQYAREELDKSHENVANILNATNSSEAIYDNNTTPEGIVKLGLAIPHVAEVNVKNLDGEILASGDGGELHDYSLWRIKAAEFVFNDHSYNEQRLQNVFFGKYMVTVRMDRIGVSEKYFFFFELILFIGLLATILGIALNTVLYEIIIVRPLASLSRQVECMDPENPKQLLLSFPSLLNKTSIGRSVLKINSLLAQMSKIQSSLRQLTTRDSTTNLPNRTLTIEYIDALVNRTTTESKQGAVIVIDLDRFSEFKCVITYEQIEAIAQGLAEDLLSIVGKKHFIGRVGPETFAVVIDEIKGATHAASIAENIYNQINQSSHSRERAICLNIYMGISVCPNDDVNGVDLLEKAIRAAIDVRGKRANKWAFYDEALDNRAHKRIKIAHDLLQGIDRREFNLFLQPKFSTDGAVSGVEALVRWSRNCSLVPPDDFIPIAESTGLIVPLGNYIICEAVRIAVELKNCGFHIPIAINISPAQLAEAEFVDFLYNEVKTANLYNELIELEITEYALAQEDSGFTQCISNLRDLGFRIAIDDFGTGYSSLEYLKRFPVDVLKIDRSFISDIPRDVAIASTIINLAERFNIETVAEGIETYEQKVWCEANNCTALQGFLLARPMPLAEFIKTYSLDHMSNKIFKSTG